MTRRSSDPLGFTPISTYAAPQAPVTLRLLGGFVARDALETRRSPSLPGPDSTPASTSSLGAESSSGVVAVRAGGTHVLPVHAATRPDGTFAVVDGEFYNDHPFANHADLVLDAHTSGGPSAVAALDGVATVTLWDAARGRLILLRDADGIGPCFYTQVGGALYWSSDFRALLPYTDDRSVDLDALELLLASGFVPSPRTLVAGIRRLPAGKMLVADDPAHPRVVDGHRYQGQPKRRLTKQERSEGFGALLEASVRRRFEPGRPSAVLLSGGVDSTLLLALIVRRLGVPVPAYTFQYLDYDGWKNESPEARKATRYLGVPHYEVPVSPRELADRLPELVEEYGLPFTFGVHSFKLDALTADGVEAIYSGQGSGWYGFRREALALQYGRLPAPLRRVLRLAPRTIRRGAPGFAARLEGVMHEGSLAEHAFAENIASADVRAALLTAPGAELRHRRALELYERVIGEYGGESDRDRVFFAGQRLASPDHSTFWNYRWSRRHDVVLRQPYRDQQLMDFMFHLHRPESGKAQQRRFAETLLPRELAWAPKLHQHAPVIEWLRGGPLHDFVRDQLSETRLRDSGLFDAREVHRLLDAHRAGAATDTDHAWAIWSVLTTVLWQERVLRAGPRALAAS